MAENMKMRLSRSMVGEAEAEAVRKVICEDGYLGMGKATQEFEQEVAAYLGVSPWQIISVNSGTAALHMAVAAMVERARARGAMPAGKPRVLVPTLTFIACFQAVLAAGCEPVPCDVLPETGTLDLDDARRRLSPDVIGMMFVDYASNPWHIDEVYAFAQERGLALCEDAAHAFGCRHHGRKTGSFGDLVCFSFDGIKNITCGEGGCLVAFDRDSADFCADFRLLGVEGDTAKRFSGGRSWEPDVRHQGMRYHMSNIMAAIGRVQLGRLESEFIPTRRRLRDLYAARLALLAGIKLLETDPEDFIVPHIMPVRVLEGKKEHVLRVLHDAGIPTGMHYKPNHLLSLFGNGALCLPHAEELYSQLVTLPLHPGLSGEDVENVCATLAHALK